VAELADALASGAKTSGVASSLPSIQILKNQKHHVGARLCSLAQIWLN
jgi:hypothetical protein